MTSNLPSTNPARAAAVTEIDGLSKAGLIIPEQAKALSLAVGAAHVLREVATPPGQRHFARIDTLLSVRLETPVSRAREVLAKLGQQWENVHTKFHAFRERFFQVKAMRARAAQMRRNAELLKDEIDAAVMLADAALEEARADKLQAEIAQGEASLRADLERAQTQSQRYAALCTQNGNKEFTEADFRNEEISYLLKSILWHVAQTGKLRDMRDSRKQNAFNAAQKDSYAGDFAKRAEALKHSRVVLPRDALKYLAELGVAEAEISADIHALMQMREGFDLVTAPMDQGRSFEDHFNGWIDRTAAKYLDRVKASVAQNGTERLDRIMTLIRPTEDDAGKRSVGSDIDRGSTIE